MTSGDSVSQLFSFLSVSIPLLLAAYVSILFLMGTDIVFLFYALIPSFAIALFGGAWITLQSSHLEETRLTTIIFVSLFIILSVVYRFFLEPLIFSDVYDIHFLFERFSILQRIIILMSLYIISYFSSRRF